VVQQREEHPEGGLGVLERMVRPGMLEADEIAEAAQRIGGRGGKDDARDLDAVVHAPIPDAVPQRLLEEGDVISGTVGQQVGVTDEVAQGGQDVAQTRSPRELVVGDTSEAADHRRQPQAGVYQGVVPGDDVRRRGT